MMRSFDEMQYLSMLYILTLATLITVQIIWRINNMDKKADLAHHADNDDPVLGLSDVSWDGEHYEYYELFSDIIFIQINTHALVDAHPHRYQAHGTQNGWIFLFWYQKYMNLWGTVLIFAQFQVRFCAHIYVPTSWLAHA